MKGREGDRCEGGRMERGGQGEGVRGREGDRVRVEGWMCGLFVLR